MLDYPSMKDTLVLVNQPSLNIYVQASDETKVFNFEEGNGNPLQYSCLGNPMDRGAWWAIVHRAAEESPNLVTKQQLLAGLCRILDEYPDRIFTQSVLQHEFQNHFTRTFYHGCDEFHFRNIKKIVIRIPLNVCQYNILKCMACTPTEKI